MCTCRPAGHEASNGARIPQLHSPFRIIASIRKLRLAWMLWAAVWKATGKRIVASRAISRSARKAGLSAPAHTGGSKSGPQYEERHLSFSRRFARCVSFWRVGVRVHRSHALRFRLRQGISSNLGSTPSASGWARTALSTNGRSLPLRSGAAAKRSARPCERTACEVGIQRDGRQQTAAAVAAASIGAGMEAQVVGRGLESRCCSLRGLHLDRLGIPPRQTRGWHHARYTQAQAQSHDHHAVEPRRT